MWCLGGCEGVAPDAEDEAAKVDEVVLLVFLDAALVGVKDIEDGAAVEANSGDISIYAIGLAPEMMGKEVIKFTSFY